MDAARSSTTSGGTESVLYAFQGGTDGELPLASLISDDAGNLYGTTSFGGTFGAGTVFEVSPAGQETVLYSFKGGTDGEIPFAGVVLDSERQSLRHDRIWRQRELQERQSGRRLRHRVQADAKGK